MESTWSISSNSLTLISSEPMGPIPTQRELGEEILAAILWN
jgi:hypothetical protein